MSDPRERLVSVNTSPLQHPDRDRQIRESVLGGPKVALDVRMYLSVEDLEELLAKARSSLTRRVVLNRPGLRVKLWESACGHRYETWSLICSDIAPETSALVSGLHERIFL